MDGQFCKGNLCEEGNGNEKNRLLWGKSGEKRKRMEMEGEKAKQFAKNSAPTPSVKKRGSDVVSILFSVSCLYIWLFSFYLFCVCF